jgi:hypothetical protein
MRHLTSETHASPYLSVESGEEAAEVGLDEEEQKADAAVARLLQTFVNIRDKFGPDFVNVICAVNGLQQFKVAAMHAGSL